ncbi:MAG: pyridoxamine 5'-phosphate oxidase family protein [Actinomycetota bacterium]|nr:pyridoxamine 5'-phosphate oxidase family protein [Actinomycetota bacterium]
MLIDEGLELLTEEQCRALLPTEAIGRIGVTIGALPAIFPVNYQMVGQDIVFRTGTATNLRAAVEGGVVGFEVDHVDPSAHEGWSVLVVGVARRLTDGERAELGDLGLSPWAGPDRANMVRIHPEMTSGRRIAKKGHRPLPA